MNRNPLRGLGAAPMRAVIIGSSMLGDGVGVFSPPRRRSFDEKPERPCLRCGTMHQHNNSWCSAECCRLYRLEKKQALRIVQGKR